jgi:hypothetical protein
MCESVQQGQDNGDYGRSQGADRSEILISLFYLFLTLFHAILDYQANTVQHNLHTFCLDLQ